MDTTMPSTFSVWATILKALQAPSEKQIHARQFASIQKATLKIQGLDKSDIEPLAKTLNAIHDLANREANFIPSFLNFLREIDDVPLLNFDTALRGASTKAKREWLMALSNVLESDFNEDIQIRILGILFNHVKSMKGCIHLRKMIESSGMMQHLFRYLKKCEPNGKEALVLMDLLLLRESIEGALDSFIELEAMSALAFYLEKERNQWNFQLSVTQRCILLLRKFAISRKKSISNISSSEFMAEVFAVFLYEALVSCSNVNLTLAQSTLLQETLLTLSEMAEGEAFSEHLLKTGFLALSMTLLDACIPAAVQNPQTHALERKKVDVWELLIHILTKLCNSSISRTSILESGIAPISKTAKSRVTGFVQRLISIKSAFESNNEGFGSYLQNRLRKRALHELCQLLLNDWIQEIEDLDTSGLFDSLELKPGSELLQPSLIILCRLIEKEQIESEWKEDLILQLIALLRHPTIKAVSLILTFLCNEEGTRYVFVEKGGVEAVIEVLPFLMSTSSLRPCLDLIAVLSVIQNVVVPDTNAQLRFIERKGMEGLLDLLETTDPFHHSQLLTTMADLLLTEEGNDAFRHWKSKTFKNRTSLRLLIHLWMDLDQPNCMIHDSKKSIQFGKQSAPGIEKPSKETIRRKIYTVFSIVGFENGEWVRPEEMCSIGNLQLYEISIKLDHLKTVERNAESDGFLPDPSETPKLHAKIKETERFLDLTEAESAKRLEDLLQSAEAEEKHHYDLLIKQSTRKR